jgi:hypothetical protein
MQLETGSVFRGFVFQCKLLVIIGNHKMIPINYERMNSVFIKQLAKVPFSAELIKFEYVKAALKRKYGGRIL